MTAWLIQGRSSGKGTIKSKDVTELGENFDVKFKPTVNFFFFFFKVYTMARSNVNKIIKIIKKCSLVRALP